MIGIVVVAHFNLAREMVAATELIVGKQEQFTYVDIFPDKLGRGGDHTDGHVRRNTFKYKSLFLRRRKSRGGNRGEPSHADQVSYLQTGQNVRRVGRIHLQLW